MYLPQVRRQTNDALTGITPPGIPYDLFIGFLWAGFAVASIFIAGRLYARLLSSSSRRIYLDDAFILFAYILLLITAVLWQWGTRDMYYVLNANAGLVQIGPDFPKRLHRFLLVSFIVEIFFYTILIMFKLSLLFFFKRLGSSADRFKYFWWPTLIFSICTYFVAIGDVEYKCYFGSFEELTVGCNTRHSTYFLKVTLDVNCALDVLSDFLIMAIPIFLLWNIQIRLSKKIALFGLFSLSIITMGVAIARAADIGATQKSNGLPDSSYLWFWSSVQSFLCIVVSCASAFRQLFMASNRSNSKPVWTTTDRFYDRMISSFQSKNKSPDEVNLYDIPGTNQMGESFDYVSMRKGSEAASQRSSQSPIVFPNLGMPVAAGYKAAPGQNFAHANKITKKVEYSVTQGPS